MLHEWQRQSQPVALGLQPGPEGFAVVSHRPDVEVVPALGQGLGYVVEADAWVFGRLQVPLLQSELIGLPVRPTSERQAIESGLDVAKGLRSVIR